jgi:putative FmdB family regulatory protein
MPMYEYQCESCSNRFERIQKFSDPPIDTCPKCGKGPVRKLISSPAIQFKGSGWYITDYARKSSADAGQAGGTGTTGKPDKGDAAASKSEAKSDSSSASSSTSSSSSSSDAAPAKTGKD